jgi:alanyl-tRNA synthetase
MAANRQELTADELAQALSDLPGWTVEEGRLHKTFEFDDFSQALGWMVRAGVEVLGGKGGGGRPDFAQGGGPNADKAEAALEAIAGAVSETAEASA